MNIDPFLIWLETTPLSEWITGSPSMFAFPGILAVHAIGMGLAAGLSVALDLRVLGVARGMAFREFQRFQPFLWLGFWINLASGVLLLIGYPTKALSNPVFYLKLVLIAVGIGLLVRIGRLSFSEGADPNAPSSRQLRGLAVVSIVCWTAAVSAGRLLAYTYHRLTAFD